MARKEVVDETPIMNGQGTLQQLSDGTSKIVWAEGASLPQVIPNKKNPKG